MSEEKTVFRFYPSYLEAAESMDDARRLEFYDALARYGILGEEPDFGGDGWLESVFATVKPNVDHSKAAYIAGCKGGRPKKKSKDEPVETVENPVENTSLEGEKGFNPPFNPSGNGFKPKEKEKEKEKKKEKSENPLDQTGDGPGPSNGPATPSREEVRAEAARSGFAYVDPDAFVESLRSIPPGTDWKLELAKADMAAWGEKHGMKIADAMEAV